MQACLETIETRSRTVAAQPFSWTPRVFRHAPAFGKFPWFSDETANGPSLARGPRLDPIGETTRP